MAQRKGLYQKIVYLILLISGSLPYQLSWVYLGDSNNLGVSGSSTPLDA